LTFSIVPLLEQVVGDARRPLYVLSGAVALVMLVVCANVANLSLARAAARQKEIAVRTALGATRRRLVRQLLTESVLLSFLGGILGVLILIWSLDWIKTLGTESIPRMPDIRIDARVLLFTLVASAFTGILFGLVPAFRASRLDLNETLKESGREASGIHSMWGRRRNLRQVLVVSELALSVVLLIGAGLLFRSFLHLQAVHPGFEARNLLTFELTLAGQKYGNAQAVLAAYRGLWERLDTLPGVTSSGGTTALPLSQTFAWTPITIEGRVPPPGERFINADARVVGGRYFQTMGIPLLQGRYFREQDSAGGLPVVIVDERLAAEYWPNQDPIGKRIRRGGLDSSSPWLTVVGVVGRVKHEALDSNPRIVFYLAQSQNPVRAMTIVLRSRIDPTELTPAVRAEIGSLDPDLPMYRVSTMEWRVGQSLARRRFSMLLLGVFAVLALTLAAVGIYGLLAYLVSRGARDIGIRIAMGATQGRVLLLIVREGMMLAGAGVLLGLAGAGILTRFMRSLLFGVTHTDLLTFAAVPALLALVALLACYLPARRAARVDPMTALRCE
jgi:predicted permease